MRVPQVRTFGPEIFYQSDMGTQVVEVLWLAAISLFVGEGFDAGELFAFEEFEAGAAAGADVGDFVGYAGLVDGAY